MGAVPYAPHEDPDDREIWGRVLDAGRGHVPYTLIHGESLVAVAAWSLEAAGVHAADMGVGWEVIVDGGSPLVLLDSLCPMTPPGFIIECVHRSVVAGVVVAGVRPVTDTIKVIEADEIGQTVDRAQLAALASPLVLPASVVRSRTDWPGEDVAAILSWLRDDGYVVELVEAPPEARRLSGPDDVRIVEALTAGTRSLERLGTEFTHFGLLGLPKMRE